jgi:hypothetical protein
MKVLLGQTPTEPAPDPGKPYAWVVNADTGEGFWLLLTTDTSDGVPAALNLPG